MSAFHSRDEEKNDAENFFDVEKQRDLDPFHRRLRLRLRQQGNAKDKNSADGNNDEAEGEEETKKENNNLSFSLCVIFLLFCSISRSARREKPSSTAAPVAADPSMIGSFLLRFEQSSLVNTVGICSSETN